MSAEDFPHSFKHAIIYHNLKSFQHNEQFNEVWTNPTQQFNANEKELYIKLELNEESFEKWKEAKKLDPSLSI